MYKKILISGLLLLSLTLQAQTNEMNFMIKGEPFYLIKYGLCVNFEKRISPTRWLMVTPQFYANYNNKNGDGDSWGHNNYSKFTGEGLDLAIKSFVSRKFYFGYGTTWQHYNFSIPQLVWPASQEGDLNVFLPEYQYYNEQINKFGVNGIFGFQNRMLKGMFLDIYSGWGIRYSAYHSKSGPVVKYNSDMGDFGYTGITFLIGVRVGVGW